MNDGTDRDVALFTEAVQMPTGERAAYLERACANDSALLRRVEGLLRAHENVGDFLEKSPDGAAMVSKQGTASGEKPSNRIGRYKLLQEIGEGGCGVVFMAEQEEPVRRRVALKVVKPGMDTKSVIARFEAERQALALMDHSNIAKVFDAGATESGRPYFVMELVRGIKITDYCDQESLTTAARLELFTQVCHAVQHAHQKGIIHRDIKPSNILVTTTTEGKPLPKVIDFGIAKATTGQRLTDKTLFTAFEMLIGTPAYMSPEQAALTSVDVDTRTDIYSLGVLLYELLTSTTPFDTRELLKAGLDEVRRVIRNEEPIRPSTRLSTMMAADLTSVSKHRHSEPPNLIREVRGDLDWIVMKALEKDRTRRYETANGLALDVERFLANEPISARPPSTLYKFQKTALRNKLLFGGIGVIAILLVASLAAVTASLGRERQARRQAETEEARSRQVTQFLKAMLQGVGPSVARGRDTVMLREILDRTAERIGSEIGNQPTVEAELRSLIGRLYLEIGNYDGAEKMHRAALTLYRKRFGPESPEAAASLNDLGVALWKEWKQPEAEAAHREALAIRRRLYGNEHADVATSLNNLADVYRHYQRPTQAEPLAREALRIRRKRFGNDSLEAADSLRVLSILLGDEDKPAEAEATAREVLAIRRKRIGPEDPLVAASLADVAWAAGKQRKWDEVESLQREALAMQRKLLSDGHPASMDSLHNLCATLEGEGKYADAETFHREALTFWNQRAGREAPQALAQLEALVRDLMAQKKFADAEQFLDEALTPAFVRRPSSANLLALRVDLKARRGQWREAAADAALAFEHQPFNPRYSMVAALFVKTHNRPAYEQFCKRLLTTFANTTNIYVADQVAKACLFLPSSEVNLKVVGLLADIAVTHGIGDPDAVPFFQVCKALSEYRRGHHAEAIEWAQKPLKIPRVYVHGHAYAVLAMAYWRLGEKDEARAMLAKGDTLAPPIMPPSIAEDPGNAWLAWLYARISLDEATALVESPAAAQGK
jgi:serine/threonine protein kinase/tetratricopeptide (TPR) repeat protein